MVSQTPRVSAIVTEPIRSASGKRPARPAIRTVPPVSDATSLSISRRPGAMLASTMTAATSTTTSASTPPIA